MIERNLKLRRVVILGRPNVGKSTLFNRIVGRRRALVGDEPGMTRDRIYGRAEWLGKPFELVDTGGLIPESQDLIASEIFRQARVAIEEADHLILVVDGRNGAVPQDEELAMLLRRMGKPLALAVNKIDTFQTSGLAAEFYGLGIRDVFPLSAEHGLGVDDLLDRVTADFPAGSLEEISDERPRGDASLASQSISAGCQEVSESAEAGDAPRSMARINIAIIGRPNVGKSTLLNRLVNQERSIVTPLPGTTRDAVDAEIERDGLCFRFIDTAGIRRKGKTKLLAEKLSVIQARKHLERADVALVIIDAVEGVTALDTHIGGYAHESLRSVILVVNKWDAVAKGAATTQDFAKIIRRRMKYLDYAPIVFISALKGQRLQNLYRAIVEVTAARRTRVSTAQMNRFLEEVDLERASVPAGKPSRILYMTQAGVAPPTFVAFTNRTGKLHFAFERFLENRIRERFGFAGTPILIKARARKQ